MAKSVRDAAIMLGALEGAAPDPHDAATRTCTPPPRRDYTRFLTPGALKGARIGIPRASFYARLRPEVEAIVAETITTLRAKGAVVVDPADIPSVVETDPAKSYLAWGICSSDTEGRGHDENCSVVLKYGMKRDFNNWLALLGPSAPVKTLTELIAWNAARKDGGAMRYGQVLLEISDEMDVERDRARYEADRARDLFVSATHGIDEVMKANGLDALLFPSSSGSAIAARAGYPSVIVPAGLVEANGATLPPDFDPKPQPYGVMFTGMACSEPKLLALAYAYEQASKKRVAPASTP
jgi:amidase